MNPLVSIIIPVYNGSKYLAQAIESALKQSYKNIEIIVVNDGSNDNGATERVAQEFGSDITYITKLNGGVASALNMGIKRSKGDYISWLSHDDILLPNKIKHQIDNQSHLEKKVILYGDVDYIDEDGIKIGELRLPPTESGHFYRNQVMCKIFQSPWRANVFVANGCTMLFPKEVFFKVGLFNEALKVTQDNEMWLRLNKYYDFILMHEPLILSRKHKLAGSITMRDIMVVEDAHLIELALQMYVPGDDKFDLDIGKTLFALSLFPVKINGYNILWNRFWVENKNFEDIIYAFMSLLTKRKFIRAVGKKFGI